MECDFNTTFNVLFKKKIVTEFMKTLTGIT